MEKNLDNCVFCKIVRGEIPATVVLQDEHTLVFMDIGSVNPGHMLVAAKPHVENLQGMDEALAGALFRSAARAAKAIEKVYKPAGISVYQANGAAAGQTVFHAHIHVLPRWENDGLTFTWPVKNPSRDELERVAAQLRAAL
ncbi:MAG: Protein hit [Rhodocyclaceae bacterium]|mgnify:CR=1 FL=1|jgi:histidine triad (HIT) family protein|nr:Protein hit [Rhodocyclaceae bacterium]